MMQRLFTYVLAAAAALSTSCQRKAIPPAATESPFSITLSSGGGFSGQYTGYALSTQGTVRHWESRGAGRDTTLWERPVPAARILDFRNRLEAGGALAMTLRKSGNMTTSVKLEMPDTTITWSWSGTDAEAMPEPFQSWYPDVLNYCQSLNVQSPADGK